MRKEKRVKGEAGKSSGFHRPEYVAAVRYTDGRRELFHVKFAENIQDARRVALQALMDVHSLLVAERKCTV